MRIKNTEEHYGLIAIFLHWLMAILIISEIILGLYMVDMPISLKKLQLFTLHKELGMVALGLALIRILWRLTNTTPDLSAVIPRWQVYAARAAHWSFYFLMFALPLSGWLLISAAGVPLSLFGWFLIPNLMDASKEWIEFYTEIHQFFGYALIAVLGAHSSAALAHHFYFKDDILKRILK